MNIKKFSALVEKADYERLRKLAFKRKMKFADVVRMVIKSGLAIE